MIRVCTEQDIGTMVEIIDGSARAYEGHIPADCYHQPYMPAEELRSEIATGVTFSGYQEDGSLVAVMGIQDKGPVVLGPPPGRGLEPYLKSIAPWPFVVYHRWALYPQQRQMANPDRPSLLAFSPER